MSFFNFQSNAVIGEPTGGLFRPGPLHGGDGRASQPPQLPQCSAQPHARAGAHPQEQS